MAKNVPLRLKNEKRQGFKWVEGKNFFRVDKEKDGCGFYFEISVMKYISKMK
jgi:hypothetical protein